MLWPWAERARSTTLVLGERIPFEPTDIPSLIEWKNKMRVNPVVSGIYHTPEAFYKVILMKTGALPPDYDSI